jgi:TonB family protein
MQDRKRIRIRARYLSPWLFLSAFPVFLMASGRPPSLRVSSIDSLSQRERQLRRLPVHVSEFADVLRLTARTWCEATLPPQALTTPDPLLDAGGGVKIKVSFIVGIDGRVHSALILESAGTSQDHQILKTVHAWRYRPEMCNGVPTESEGKIEFSSR